MKHILLALCLLSPAAASAQYFDGLPAATAVSPSDIIPICQGGTAGRPGTCTTRRASVSLIPSTVTAPLISQGQSTAPLTADQAQFVGGLNNPTLTARQIYADATGCSTSNPVCGNADGVRGVSTAIVNSTLINVTGVAGYVLNQNATTGNGQNSVAVFGVGISAVDNAYTWGINTILTDSTSQAVSSGTGRLLQDEFDFNVTSPNTTVSGLVLVGASLSQPASANGFTVGGLTPTGYNVKWNNAFISSDGVVDTALLVGTASAPTTANVPSQVIAFSTTNSSGVEQVEEMYAAPTAIVVDGQFVASGVISAAAGLNVSSGTLGVFGMANGIKIEGSATSVAPAISAFGSDANINISFAPKGTGSLVIGANTGQTCTGTPSASFATVDGLVTHC